MKQTAQGLAALGRGPDTQLVHMAPSEVAGLQALAMKHGGSLTINPDTGLPEAGFLSSILPMVLGAGAMMIPGMQGIGAGWIGAGIGGLTTLATGSLSKGLMAGLGAYGGAGLASGLMGAGTGALSSAAGSAGAAGAGTAVPVAATEAIGAGAAQSAAQAAAPDILGGTASELAGAYGYPTVAAPTIPAINAAQAIPTVTQAPALSQSAADIGNAYAQEQAAQNAVAQKLATTTPTQTLGAGLTAAGNAPGAFLKANAYPLGAMGLSALAGMQPDALNAPKEDEGLIRPYTYSREKIPGAFEDVAGEPMSSKERRYFTDSYTALTPYKAPGPEYKKMASGGPVEAMSNTNALGASTGYPQSDIRTGAYSNPFQQPMGQNVVTGAQDAAVDPYTGQAQFADGGSVGGYTYDQATGQYSGGAPLGGDSPRRGFLLSGGAGGFGRSRDLADLSPLAQYEGGSIGGYTYDPATQSYTHAAPVPVQATAGSSADQPRFMGFTGGFATDEGGRDSGGRANGGLLALAQGGISDLGSYSDGGRLLRGPGDGVSDSIPARIGAKQEARLADGEFVVPARIVSELGNGSTEAGARQLYAMMDRVQKNRKKSIGKGKVAADSKSSKLLPA